MKKGFFQSIKEFFDDPPKKEQSNENKKVENNKRKSVINDDESIEYKKCEMIKEALMKRQQADDEKIKASNEKFLKEQSLIVKTWLSEEQ